MPAVSVRRSLAPPVEPLPATAASARSGTESFFASTTTVASPLPPLESFAVIEAKRHMYVGPTDESNWVIPGCVLPAS